MAQFGRVLRSGRRGRRFKSCHLDHIRSTKFMISTQKPEYSGFFATQIPKIFLKNEGWHWGEPFWGVEPIQRRFHNSSKVYIQAHLDFSAKIVYKISDSVLVLSQIVKTLESSPFYFPKQMIEYLSAICEPFLTASVAGRETTPPLTVKAAVDDFWTSCGRYIDKAE